LGWGKARGNVYVKRKKKFSIQVYGTKTEECMQVGNPKRQIHHQGIAKKKTPKALPTWTIAMPLV
jgi:hypothetical protein